MNWLLQVVSNWLQTRTWGDTRARYGRSNNELDSMLLRLRAGVRGRYYGSALADLLQRARRSSV